MWTNDVYSSFWHLISPRRFSNHNMNMYKYIHFFVFRKNRCLLLLLFTSRLWWFSIWRWTLELEATRNSVWSSFQSQHTSTNPSKSLLSSLYDVLTIITSPLPNPWTPLKGFICRGNMIRLQRLIKPFISTFCNLADIMMTMGRKIPRKRDLVSAF